MALTTTEAARFDSKTDDEVLDWVRALLMSAANGTMRLINGPRKMDRDELRDLVKSAIEVDVEVWHWVDVVEETDGQD